MKRRNRVSRVLLVLGVLFLGYLWFENTTFGVSHYTVESAKIPNAFNGYKILQLSDLHNKMFGSNQGPLIDAIKDEKPNTIVITGDLINGYKYGLDGIQDLLEGIRGIAPVYFITGNHEYYYAPDSEELKQYYKVLKENNVHILTSQSVILLHKGGRIQLSGVPDPYMIELKDNDDDEMVESVLEEKMKESLNSLERKENYQILLAHRPEYAALYKDEGADLVLSGHTHGGQIRLPFFGSVYAPGQKLFPTYGEGMVQTGEMTSIISRGLGNSSIPIRVFDRPEFTVINLQHKQ